MRANFQVNWERRGLMPSRGLSASSSPQWVSLSSSMASSRHYKPMALQPCIDTSAEAGLGVEMNYCCYLSEVASLLVCDATQPREAAPPNRLKNNADKPCKRRVPFPISMAKP